MRDTGLGYGEETMVAGTYGPMHPWCGCVRKPNENTLTTTLDILGQRMTVVAVQHSDERFELTDDWGGSRTDIVRNSASIGGEEGGGKKPAVTSFDQLGRIVHRIVQMVTNDMGFPVETWFGETLVVRYHYPQLAASEVLKSGGVRGLWLEFVDARTGDLVLDSRALGELRSAPRFH